MRTSLLLILLICCDRCCLADDAVVLGGKIIKTCDIGVASAAVARLEAYLKSGEKSDGSIVLGDASVAGQYGVAAPDEKSEESFSIAPVSRDGPRLIISGRSDKGIKQGVYYVLRNLTHEDGKMLLRHPTTRSSPVIKRRVSHVGGYTRQAFDRETGKRLPKGVPVSAEQLPWNYITFWDPQRIADYIDLLDFFGYNGIEEPPMLYNPKENADPVAVARRKVVRERIERNGMIAVAKIDGTLFANGPVPYGSDTKAQYDQYYRQMAEAAAPYNDFLLTHWVDAGGWKGDAEHPCTIELLQRLHMQIDGEFRRVNPRIESFLSLWFLDHPNYQRWLGYQGVETILNNATTPKSVGLAMSRNYRPDESQTIATAGRKPAVWGWYTADHELLYTMHVHTHALGDYFGQLPPDAGELLFLHTLDNCQRETNIYTVYVGAQMMWNPKGDPEEYLRDVARLVYGPKLEDKVFRALKAIADVRCGKKCSGCWTPAAKSDSNDVVTFGQGYAQATAAYKEIETVELDKDYVPPIHFHRSPQVLLTELKEHTQAVAAYMAFLKDKQQGKTPATEVPKAPGPFEYYERLRYLQNR